MPHPNGEESEPGLKPCHAACLRVIHGRIVPRPQGFEGYHRKSATASRHKLAEVLLVVSMREGVPPQGADVFQVPRHR